MDFLYEINVRIAEERKMNDEYMSDLIEMNEADNIEFQLMIEDFKASRHVCREESNCFQLRTELLSMLEVEFDLLQTFDFEVVNVMRKADVVTSDEMIVGPVGVTVSVAPTQDGLVSDEGNVATEATVLSYTENKPDVFLCDAPVASVACRCVTVSDVEKLLHEDARVNVLVQY
jgi:hypothetical protein